MRDREQLHDGDLPTRLWKTRDVAEFLVVSERTVRALVARRGLPCMRIGGAVRFDPASIALWARRQRKEV
jgi:excisionase family DNA binding protein